MKGICPRGRIQHENWKEATGGVYSCGCHDAAGFGGSCHARVGGGGIYYSASAGN
ncbi:hypothetical protein [Collinsella aerofaciens]|uniref:hypothetical protein n=1 Tax=Collinsella aerofaciens TaxID=74426 RepID=UPI00374D9B01